MFNSVMAHVKEDDLISVTRTINCESTDLTIEFGCNDLTIFIPNAQAEKLADYINKRLNKDK